MQFLKLARVADFARTRIKSYQILAKNIAIVRDHDGTFYATEISCKHNNVDLTTGYFRGDVVTCPRHGWVYNIKTGQCLNQPAAPLRKHALEMRGQDIYVATTPIEPEEPEQDWTPEIQFKQKTPPAPNECGECQ